MKISEIKPYMNKVVIIHMRSSVFIDIIVDTKGKNVYIKNSGDWLWAPDIIHITEKIYA